MPIYDYQCSACETIFETLQGIQENIDDPPTHCPKCDPFDLNEGTLYKYHGNMRPAFNLKGKGFFKPGWN